MKIDIVMPVYNQLEYTKECVDSIIGNTRLRYRIIIVDDASKPETAAYLDQLAAAKKAVLLRNTVNSGWVGSVNKGLKAAEAEYVCVVNNDIRVFPGWLSEMTRIADSDKRIGLVNPCWELPQAFNDKPGEYYRKVVVKKEGRYVETDWARGFCFLIKRQVIDRIGGLDEGFAPGYYDDWDYSVRAINNGFVVVRAEGAFVRHYGNVTFGKVFGKLRLNAELLRKQDMFEKKWGRPLRISLVLDSALMNGCAAVGGLGLRLLRDQNRLEVMDGTGRFELRHTNCRTKKVLRGFLKLACLFSLLLNLRYRNKKRYDAVICSPGLNGFLRSFPYLKDRFRILPLDLNGTSGFEPLMAEIKAMKLQPR